MNTPPVIDTHRHAVKFYQNEQSLFTTAGGFLSQGLVDRQPAILIATEEHRIGILAELTSRLIDVPNAIRLGELVVLDANEMLALFMEGDVPNPGAFSWHVGRLVADMVEKHPKSVVVRAYGEMVDVLWKERRRDAAIRLEILWNKLAGEYGFALLCGYAMGHFYKETALIEKVCEQHNHVMPLDPVTTEPTIQ